MTSCLIFPTHSCFDDALEMLPVLIEQDRRNRELLHLVHAICLMPDGSHYAHAWVERENECLFFGIINGEKLLLVTNKDKFYQLYKVQETTRYTVREAAKENFNNNHYGPWKPEYYALCSNNKETYPIDHL